MRPGDRAPLSRSSISQRLGVVFSGLLPAARGELVAGSRTLDDASHQPAPTDGQGRKHVLAGTAPNLRLRSGSVVRRPLGQTPYPGPHRRDIFGLSRLLGKPGNFPRWRASGSGPAPRSPVTGKPPRRRVPNTRFLSSGPLWTGINGSNWPPRGSNGTRSSSARPSAWCSRRPDSQ